MAFRGFTPRGGLCTWTGRVRLLSAGSVTTAPPGGPKATVGRGVGAVCDLGHPDPECQAAVPSDHWDTPTMAVGHTSWLQV